MGRIRQGRERRKLEDMDEGGHDNDDIKKERSGGGRGGEAKGRGWGDGTGHERLKHYGKLGG